MGFFNHSYRICNPVELQTFFSIIFSQIKISLKKKWSYTRKFLNIFWKSLMFALYFLTWKRISVFILGFCNFALFHSSYPLCFFFNWFHKRSEQWAYLWIYHRKILSEKTHLISGNLLPIPLPSLYLINLTSKMELVFLFKRLLFYSWKLFHNSTIKNIIHLSSPIQRQNIYLKCLMV